MTSFAAIPAGSDAEISFIGGVTASAQVAATSFETWNGNNPATYSNTSFVAKWGSTTIGTAGGNVRYWFDTSSNWTSTEQSALISGLGMWSAEANISFSLAANATSANFTFKRGSDRHAFWQPAVT